MNGRRKMRTIRFNKALKALVTFVLVAALFVGDTLCALAATNVTIKEASVRVRQSASTDSTQLGSVKQGSSYDVIETVSDSSGTAWYFSGSPPPSKYAFLAASFSMASNL